MAALSERHPTSLPGSIVELRRFSADDLRLLLEEETVVWSRELEWDFNPSADLVRRFVQMHALSGYAYVQGSRVGGYAYFVCEERKGLIGDLYVMQEHRSVDTENALLQAVLADLWRTPGIRRVESQLMMLSSTPNRAVPYSDWVRASMRDFLLAPLSTVKDFAVRNHRNIVITHWTTSRQDETARLIASSYRGHIDSQINDQYRSADGARRFLMNIVQYPGCGTFYGPASYAAVDATTHALYGVSLASLVAPKSGHITQVCVAPSHKGTGLGYELMRRSLLTLAAHGCASASLTVTTANDSALRLYKKMGFVKRREFAAHVWESR